MMRARSFLFPCLLILLLAVACAPLVAAGNHSHVGNLRAEVAQRTPVLTEINLWPSDDEPGIQEVIVQPSAGTDRAVAFTVVVEDTNGHNDVQSVTFTVYEADDVTVHRAEAAAVKTSATGTTAEYSGDFAMAFYDQPGDYQVKVAATDRNGLTATGWAAFVYAELAGVSVDSAAITLNPGGQEGTAVAPGGDTRDNPSPIAFRNGGNVAIHAELSGTALANDDESASIPVGAISYALAADFTAEEALTGTASGLTLNLAPGAASQVTIYFAIAVPDGVPADTYRGTATIAAVKAT